MNIQTRRTFKISAEMYSSTPTTNRLTCESILCCSTSCTTENFKFALQFYFIIFFSIFDILCVLFAKADESCQREERAVTFFFLFLRRPWHL